MDNHNNSFGRSGSCRARGITAGHEGRSHNNSQPDNKHSRFGFLRDERGSIVDFLITCTLIVFMLFAGVDYFTQVAQYQIAQHIMRYYLERARVEGYLTSTDESQIISKFAQAQMTVTSSDILVTNPVLGNITGPLERDADNANNDDYAEIDLTIEYKPDQQPFVFGELIGVSAPSSSTYHPKVGGSVLSEYVSSS